MKSAFFFLIVLSALLVGCKPDEKDTLAELHDVKIDLKDAKIEGGLEKAMESYQRFLEQTPEAAMTPEAIRRLADLKIEKEYGFTRETENKTKTEAPNNIKAPVVAPVSAVAPTAVVPNQKEELQKDFEKRAMATQPIVSANAADAPVEGAEGLENAGAREAVELYKKLLAKFPNYERNDQVLYQLSRAYEELGQVEEAMVVMNRLVAAYPKSRYFDEVQFRRGEYFFTRKKFLDGEDAYKAIVALGPASSYYELALYKLGWALYKQEMYEEALDKFVGVLDYKVSIGYDFEKIDEDKDKQRIGDTFRVISLGFSYLGGADAILDYFAKKGARPYEVNVFSNLGEHYLEKRRYSDAAATYKTFTKRNPFHKVSPRFDMRVIDIYKKGGFPNLVIEANKEFATNYGLKSAYWQHFDVKAYPEVLGYLKTNLIELANHYHALYQDKRFEKKKEESFKEALTWYKEFLDSFPKEVESPGINYQMADLLLQHKDYSRAAAEYERTAYGYPAHEKAAAAGYASVYAYRENLDASKETEKDRNKREFIRASIQFAETFPTHEKAATVLGAAVDELFEMKNYQVAVSTGRRLIEKFPTADKAVLRSAWVVIGHGSFELGSFKEAEDAYVTVLGLTPEQDKSRAGIVDNLAASIYKQGEQAVKNQDFKAGADHFLRIAQVAPTSKIRPTAEYDASAALIQLKDWDKAAEVLQAFRKNYPKHELQGEVTKKIAYVYKESGKLALAAKEYERIETETKDDELRRSALLMAADLWEQGKEPDNALRVYKRYLSFFPKPLELALETRNKIAGIFKSKDDKKGYFAELKEIVDADLHAGSARTDRTRYLGATSALALAEPVYTEFAEIKLVKPFEKNLLRKKAAMKKAMDAFAKLPNYEVGEVTAGTTFYLAEIYYQFSRALAESERPTNLSQLELEQYEEALEEQVFPFEEKAISVHEKNLELLTLGIYNSWIDKSIEKLAALVPARYAKFEESSGYIASIDSFTYRLAEPKAVETAVGEAPKTGAQGAVVEGAEQTEKAADPATQQSGAETAASEAQPQNASDAEGETAKPVATEAEQTSPPVDESAAPAEGAAPAAQDAGSKPGDSIKAPAPTQAAPQGPGALAPAAVTPAG